MRVGDYEYRTETLGSLRDSKRVSKLISKLGRDGWELVDKQEGGILFGRARMTFRRLVSVPTISSVPVDVSTPIENRMAEDLERLEVQRATGQIDDVEYQRRRRVLGM